MILNQSVIEAYIRDPVLAAHAIFNADLDTFQRVRLRMMWWVPELDDDSGISTGKTEILWIWAQLRAMLLPQPRPYPHRIVGIYYPTLESAKSNFMPKYEKYIENSKIFREQLRPMHGGKLGYQSLDGAIQWVYRNGSIVQCPAANYANDSNNQASKRFHDLGVDEAKEADAKSNGLDAQILGRVTAPGYNNANPVWANHVVLMGHAEDPDSHPFYRRVKALRALIRDGSQGHAIITSSYRDWTPKFQKDFRPDSMIRRAKLTMSKPRFQQQWEGIWAHGTDDWYDPKELRAVCTRRVPILTRSDSPSHIFTLGTDTAPSAGGKADYNAWVVTAAKPLPPDTREVLGVFRHEDKVWRIWPCWALQVRNRSTGEISGITHRLNQRFGLSRIVFDPSGGGTWVQKEMWKRHQFFDGVMNVVSGICEPGTAHLYPQAQPISIPYARGSAELYHVWGDSRYLVSDEGIIEATHRIAKDMFASGSIQWPSSAEDRPLSEVSAMDAEQKLALQYITVCMTQFLSVTQAVDGDKKPILTKRGFLKFRAAGKKKKDLCYAALYSLVAMLSLLKDPDFNAEEETGEYCMGTC